MAACHALVPNGKISSEISHNWCITQLSRRSNGRDLVARAIPRLTEFDCDTLMERLALLQLYFCTDVPARARECRIARKFRCVNTWRANRNKEYGRRAVI